MPIADGIKRIVRIFRDSILLAALNIFDRPERVIL